MSTVRYEVRDRVAVVTIDRPEKLNAMNAEVFRLLGDHARTADADDAVRAVLVRGEGRSFSAGLDVSLFGQQASENGVPRIAIEELQDAFTSYETCRKPVVAAVRGHCLGAGLQLAIACDLRLTDPDAVFSAAEIRWGIVPDLGGTQRLPRLIGLGRAKEMVLTGRNVTAAEAERWGLVNAVVEDGTLDDRAFEVAARLAAGPPLALAAAKRLTTSAFTHGLPDGLAREAQAQRTLLASEDFREAVVASLQKRTPEYRAR